MANSQIYLLIWLCFERFIDYFSLGGIMANKERDMEILKLLEVAKKDSSKCKLQNDKIVYNKYVCKNARCITKVEQELTYDEAFELVEQNEALHRMAEEKQNKLIAKRLKKENRNKKEQNTSNINTL